MASQLLLIPFLAGGQVLFQLNVVYWSLFFEVVANVAHVLFFRWSHWRVLAAGLALSIAAAVVVAWKFGHFGGGWGASNWWCGFVRVALSYAMGVLIFRAHKAGRLPKFSAPFPVLGIGFVLAIFAASLLKTWWADLIPVVFVFPLILIAGVNAKEGRSATSAAALGAVSYPLYATHGPLTELWGVYAPHTLLSAATAGIAMVVGAFFLDRWYDGPVRAYAARRLRRPVAAPEPAAAPVAPIAAEPTPRRDT